MAKINKKYKRGSGGWPAEKMADLEKQLNAIRKKAGFKGTVAPTKMGGKKPASEKPSAAKPKLTQKELDTFGLSKAEQQELNILRMKLDSISFNPEAKERDNERFWELKMKNNKAQKKAGLS